MKVLSINGKDISLRQLAQKVRTDGRFSVLLPLIEQVVIEEYAAEKNISASDEELQQAFDNFRKSQGLYAAKDTELWMAERGISLDEMEKELEIKILAEKIRDSIPKEAVQKYFAENKSNMDAAELYIMTVKEQEVAMELLAQLKEEEADFMVLAREYSIDEKAKQGGYIGMVRRPELRADIASAVFGAEPGDVAGPFEGDDGYSLIMVNALYPAGLDENNEKEIRNILYNRFLADAEQKAKLEWAEE